MSKAEVLNTKITYHKASTIDELQQILKLQQENLPQELSAIEKEQEGFVTVHHTFNILKQMNDACPHIIAKHNGNVIGYALCMTKEFKTKISVLIPMFNKIESIISKDANYVVMGQICISKNHRKQGVFRGLYVFMAKALKLNFNIIITEVDSKNIRSLNAHKAIGFKSLKHYESNNQFWEIISLKI